MLSAGAYYSGAQTRLRGRRRPYSQPAFPAQFLRFLRRLWCGLPALIVFAVWAVLQPGIILDLVVAGLPPELRNCRRIG
jgi:phosphate transport system permease protein